MSSSKFIDNGALALLPLISKLPDVHTTAFTTKVLSEIARAQASHYLYCQCSNCDGKKSHDNAVNTSSSDSDEDVIIFRGRAHFAASKPMDNIKEKQINTINNPEPAHTTSSEITKEVIRKWRNRLTLLELAKCLAEGNTTLVVDSILGKCGKHINEFTPIWILESRPATKEESTKDRNLWVHKVFTDKEINDWVLLLDNFRKERKKRLGDAVNDEKALLEEWQAVRGGLQKVQNLENELTRVAEEIPLQQNKGS